MGCPECGDPHVKCNDECLEGGCECPECGHYDETPTPWGHQSSSTLTKAPVGSPAAEEPQRRTDDESPSNGLAQTCHKRPADGTALQSKRPKLEAELDEGTGLWLSAIRARIKDGVGIKDGDAIMRVYGQTFPHKAALLQAGGQWTGDSTSWLFSPEHTAALKQLLSYLKRKACTSRGPATLNYEGYIGNPSAIRRHSVRRLD